MMNEQAKKRCDWPGCGAEMEWVPIKHPTNDNILLNNEYPRCPNAEQHMNWECPDCGGGGQVNFTETSVDDCSRCGGVGYIHESERDLKPDNADQHGEVKVLSAEELVELRHFENDIEATGRTLNPSGVSTVSLTYHRAGRLLREIKTTIQAEKERADVAEAQHIRSVLRHRKYLNAIPIGQSGCGCNIAEDGETIIRWCGTHKAPYDQLKADIAEACRISNATLPDDFPHSVDAGPAAAILRAKLEEARERAIRAEKKHVRTMEDRDSILRLNRELTSQLDQLKAELAELVGCPSCHEDHPPSSMCPPFECRTTGLAAILPIQWRQRYIRLERKFIQLEADYAALREGLAKYGTCDGDCVSETLGGGGKCDCGLHALFLPGDILASPHPGADLIEKAAWHDRVSGGIAHKGCNYLAVTTCLKCGWSNPDKSPFYADVADATINELRERVATLEGGIDDMLHASPCHSGEDYNRMPRHHVERLRDLIHGKSMERAELIKDTPSQELTRRASAAMVEQSLTYSQAAEYVLKTNPELAKAYREYTLKGVENNRKWKGNMKILVVVLALIILAPTAWGQSQENSIQKEAALTAYKPNYYIYRKHPGTKLTQTKFQISVRYKPHSELPAFFSYTQLCDWNYGEPSAPIRTCDFNPQFFLGWERDRWAFSMGREHQSNGEPNVNDDTGFSISRSWRRDYIDGEIRGDWWALGLMAWNASRSVNNENIEDYYGTSEPRLRIFYGDSFDIRIRMRDGIRYKYRLIEVFTNEPFNQANFHWYLQWFRGYGQYMLDIRPPDQSPTNTNQIMIGIALTK